MATPSEKLAASLGVLQKLQKGGRRVFQSSELSRIHRDRLLKHGFMQAVMKGWLISASLGVRPGDSTPWFASGAGAPDPISLLPDFWSAFSGRHAELSLFQHAYYVLHGKTLLLHRQSLRSALSRVS